jgi:hypothetical protein
MTMYDLAKYDVKRNKLRSGRVRHYPSVLRAMKRLEESALVKKVGRGKGKKGAQTILYDLRLVGLAERIPLLGISELRQAVEMHRGLLPNVFGVWPSFIEAKVEDLAADRLKWTCRFLITEAEDALPFASPLWVSGVISEPEIEERFYDPQLPCSDYERWLEAVRTNEEIKEATRNMLLGRLNEHVSAIPRYLRILSQPDIMLMSKQEVDQKLEAIIQELLSWPPEKTVRKETQLPEDIDQT